MKKICLILVLFSFVSTMPSFALKYMVNDTSTRIVPSRSAQNEFYEETYYEENVQQEYVEQVHEQEQIQEEQAQHVQNEESVQEENVEYVQNQEEIHEEQVESIQNEVPVEYVNEGGREIQEGLNELIFDIRPELLEIERNYPDYDENIEENISEEQQVNYQEPVQENSVQQIQEESFQPVEQEQQVQNEEEIQQSQVEEPVQEETIEETAVEEVVSQEQQVVYEQQENIEENIEENVQVKEQPAVLKIYSREASDYYVIDTIKNPKEAVPSGFVNVVNE